MGLGNRNARRHESRLTAGINQSIFWDFQPGQRVMTVDGFAGTVASVEDGPVSGVECYIVTLANDLGGGQYSSSQLRPITDTKGSARTAADDYPELGTVLEDHPDIAPNTRLGSLQRTAVLDLSQAPSEDVHAGWHRRHDASPHTHSYGLGGWYGAMWGWPHTADDHHVNGEPCDHTADDPIAASIDSGSSDGIGEFGGDGGDDGGLTAAKTSSNPHGIEVIPGHEPSDGAESGVDEHGHLTWGGAAPGCRDTDEYSMFGQNDAVEKPPSVEAMAFAQGVMDTYNALGSKPCGCGQPGHTGGEHADWAAGMHAAGTHDAWGRPLMQPLDGHGAWSCNNYDCTEHPSSMYPQEGQPQGAPGWLKHDTDPHADLRREVNKTFADPSLKDADYLLDQQRQGPSKLSAFHSILVTSSVDPDFRFHVVAAWADVRKKAKRLRAEGGVHVTMASDGMVIAEVRGDHNVYEAGIQKLPGKHSIQQWSCGCKWGSYHWGASDDFSRFAGRMCSHALAVSYEAQSRGMFGRDVSIDDSKPSWSPRKVVVKYDIDADTNRRAPATPMRGDYGRAASLSVSAVLIRRALEAGEELQDISLAFHSAGIGGLQIQAAVNDAWGEPTGAEPVYEPGPTKPKDPLENPGSAGWATHGDPDHWARQGPIDANVAMASLSDDEAVFEPEMSREALLPLLVPLLRAVAPSVIKAVAPSVVKAVVPKLLSGGPEEGAQAELHDTPEPALPTTDGDAFDPGDPTSLEPEDPSFVSTGSIEDVVAQFQATAGAAGLGGGGSAAQRDGAEIAAMARKTLAKESMKTFSPAEQAQIVNEGERVKAANLDRLDLEGTHYTALEAAMAAAEDDDDTSWMA